MRVTTFGADAPATRARAAREPTATREVAAATARHRVPAAPARAAVAPSSPCRNAGSASALAKPSELVKRSAGIFSSARRIAASTLAGIDLRTAVADTGAPWMILPSTAWAVLPGYGGSPTSISYRTHARAKISLAGPTA